MNTWTSYPKIWNFGHPQVRDLLTDTVHVQEKVDGSQFSFGFIDGILRVRSKGAEIVVDAPPQMFKRAVETVKSIAGDLREGWTYRGEVLDRPKHNVLAYDRTPRGHIILFDIAIGYEEYAAYDVVQREAERLGLEVVPMLYVGTIETPDQLRKFLDTTSILGGQKIEGVVVKNYFRHGIDGKQLMGKFVSEQFKETHKGEWRKDNPQSGDILERITTSFRTPARWAKAVQHLNEENLLEHSPRDIGKLILEVKKDVQAECREEIIEMLLKWAMPHVLRSCTAGLPEWYKERLLELQFSTPGDPDTFPQENAVHVDAAGSDRPLS